MRRYSQPKPGTPGVHHAHRPRHRGTWKGCRHNHRRRSVRAPPRKACLWNSSLGSPENRGPKARQAWTGYQRNAAARGRKFDRPRPFFFFSRISVRGSGRFVNGTVGRPLDPPLISRRTCNQDPRPGGQLVRVTGAGLIQISLPDEPGPGWAHHIGQRRCRMAVAPRSRLHGRMTKIPPVIRPVVHRVR